MDMKLNYGIKISLLTEEDGGGYLVEVPDLPGCMTDGDTVEEAIAKVGEAIDSWIDAAIETGKTIPKPRYYTDDNKYSGRLTLRMPKDLHKDLVQVADDQGVSINQLILYYVSKGIGRDISATSSEYKTNIRKNFEFWLQSVADIKNNDEAGFYKSGDVDLILEAIARRKNTTEGDKLNRRLIPSD